MSCPLASLGSVSSIIINYIIIIIIVILLFIIGLLSLLLFQTVLLLKKVSRAQCLLTSFNDTTYKIIRWLRGSKKYILLGRIGMRFQFSYLTFTLYSF